jgi:hypothetical protein
MATSGFSATPGTNVMLITLPAELDKEAMSPDNLYFAQKPTTTPLSGNKQCLTKP